MYEVKIIIIIKKKKNKKKQTTTKAKVYFAIMYLKNA